MCAPSFRLGGAPGLPCAQAADAAQIGDFEWRAGAELVLTSGSRTPDLPAETARTFTIFEGTSEIQRMIIGRAVTGLDVR
jgi:alkylation response protein AidB-like acyl-CoA dehydrogenase